MALQQFDLDYGDADAAPEQAPRGFDLEEITRRLFVAHAQETRPILPADRVAELIIDHMGYARATDIAYKRVALLLDLADGVAKISHPQQGFREALGRMKRRLFPDPAPGSFLQRKLVDLQTKVFVQHSPLAAWAGEGALQAAARCWAEWIAAHVPVAIEQGAYERANELAALAPERGDPLARYADGVGAWEDPEPSVRRFISDWCW
jgi:hypothetical protein